MKTVIVYEAIFSSTQHVARVVAAALADAGADVLVTEARTTCPADLRGCDLLLVGAPTHALSVGAAAAAGTRRRGDAADVRQTLDTTAWLSLLDRAFPSRDLRPPVIVFDTRVDAVPRSSGSPATRAARALRAQGFRLVSEPSSFYVQRVGEPPDPIEADRVRAWAEGLTQGLMLGLTLPAPRSKEEDR